MKLMLSITAAAMLAGALFIQPAQAACWSNGFVTQCSHPHYWHHRYYQNRYYQHHYYQNHYYQQGW